MSLHDQTDSRLHYFPSQKGKGLVGSILFHIVIITVMIIAGITATPSQTEEGLLVNFGTDDFGGGYVEPAPSSSTEAAPLPQPTNPVTTPVTEEEINTQDFDEEAVEIKKVVQADPEAERKKQEELEAEKKRQEELAAERERLEKEEIERKRIEEEERRKQEIDDKMKNALAGRNAATSSTGEGDTIGKANQGVKTGSVDSRVRGDGTGLGEDGTSYNLEGRSAQSLPKPKYEYQGEGIVVVKVTVDREGKVTSANPGEKGSTTLDEYLLKAAKDAALLAKFDAKPNAPSVQIGTITYHFILK